MNSINEKPKVGVGVIIIKDNKILLGKRKNAHGDNTWSFPGGHLEYGEEWEDCSRREVMEETGIEIKNIRFGTATNDIFLNEQKHYITIIMISDFESGEVKIMEPDKCEKWEWFEWNKLPQPFFLPIVNLLKTNFNPLNIS
jgi:8-oxo-dGTP diphosphatase